MRRLALALLVLAGCAAAAGAEETPLARVPAGAPIVVVLHGVERTRQRLAAFVEKGLPGDDGKAWTATLDALLKDGLDDRRLMGLAPDGSLFLVVPEFRPESRERGWPWALIARVADYAVFRDGLLKPDERKSLKKDPAGYESAAVGESTVYFVDQKDYAVVTTDRDTAVAFTRKPVGLDGKLDRAVADRLLDADLAVYADLAAVRTAYGDSLKDGRETLARLAADPSVPAVGKRSLEGIGLALDGAGRLLEDGDRVLLTARVSPAGVALHLEISVRDGSPTADFLKDEKPSALDELGALPSGLAYYSALSVRPAVLRAASPLLTYVGYDADSSEGKKIREALDRTAGDQPRLRLTAASLGVKGGSLEIWRGPDPAGAADARLAFYRALGPGVLLGNGVLKDEPKIVLDAHSRRGFHFHQVRLPWDLEKTSQMMFQDESEAGLLKDAMGKEGNVWLGTDRKEFIELTDVDWYSAQAPFEDYLDGEKPIGRQRGFAETRRRLPEQASYVGVYEASDLTMRLALTVLTGLTQGHDPRGDPALFSAPPPKAGAGYYGTALTLEPGRLSADVWLPASALPEVRKGLNLLSRPWKQRFGD